MMHKKKILYIKSQWLGDMIWWLPFLARQKELGHEVYQTFYDMRYINKAIHQLPPEQKKRFMDLPMYAWWYHILQQFKDQGLIKDIVLIPYGRWAICRFFITNFRRYDLVVIPIKTKAAVIISYLLGKSRRIIFQHVNDTKTYRILADGETEGKAPPLHSFKHLVHLETLPLDIKQKYIVIFPSIWERWVNSDVWWQVIDELYHLWYISVLIWTDREKRCSDQLHAQGYTDKIIDYIWKTPLWQTIYLLHHAACVISANGWQMRIANLVNKNCINIHTVSSFLMEPPVDSISSFNLRPYAYTSCTACEAANSTLGETWIRPCVFYNTEQEGACRKDLTAYYILTYVKKSLGITHTQ